jgi:hypothetical protein
MKFDEWYRETVGISIEHARAVGVYDIDHMRKAFDSGRESMREDAAQLMEVQSPHLFMDPDEMAEKIRTLPT